MQMSSRLMRDETTQKNLKPNYNNSIYTTYSRIVQVWNFSVSMVFIHHVSKVQPGPTCLRRNMQSHQNTIRSGQIRHLAHQGLFKGNYVAMSECSNILTNLVEQENQCNVIRNILKFYMLKEKWIKWQKVKQVRDFMVILSGSYEHLREFLRQVCITSNFILKVLFLERSV